MKRLNKISDGVYVWSNGMIGTSDLSQFVAEIAYHTHSINKKQQFMLDNIKPPVISNSNHKSQLSACYAAIKRNKSKDN